MEVLKTENGPKDQWVAPLGSSDSFSVAAAKKWMLRSYGNSLDCRIVWCKWLPSKCNIFSWRAISEKIPTKVALAHRNIAISVLACPLCSEDIETTVHLFTACRFTCCVWQAIASWCRLPPIFAFDTTDLFQ